MLQFLATIKNVALGAQGKSSPIPHSLGNAYKQCPHRVNKSSPQTIGNAGIGDPWKTSPILLGKDFPSYSNAFQLFPDRINGVVTYLHHLFTNKNLQSKQLSIIHTHIVKTYSNSSKIFKKNIYHEPPTFIKNWN